MGIDEAAKAFEALFSATYLRLHGRGPVSGRPPPRLVWLLQQLAAIGPVTVGELAKTTRRAQSMISERVSRAIQHGWIVRTEDLSDRRRGLLGLTQDGRDLLRREVEVLSSDRLLLALGKLTPQERKGIVTGLQALVNAAEELGK